MYSIIYLLLTQCMLLHTSRASTLKTGNEREIQRLEKEKGELFKQINEAIDESMKYLQKANDSTSIVGISYIRDLKEQIKELNETSDDGNGGDRMGEDRTEESKGLSLGEIEMADNETRRQAGADDQMRRVNFYKHLGTQGLFDENNLFGKKKSKKWKQRYENRIIMQKKLNDWLAQREAEKVKIKKYREHAKLGGNRERCPRQGIKRKSSNGKGKKWDNKFSGRYPCCRKCCKKSYMGCL